MLKDIYLKIQDRVMNGGIGIKHYDWFNQQYINLTTEKEYDHLPFSTPAVFVEFVNPIQMESSTNKVQQATVHFKLHLVTRTASDPRAGSSSQDKALEHLDLIDQLNALMTGWNAKKT